MRFRSAVLMVCAAALALRPALASADAAGETRLREALRTATTQLRALEDERGAWQAKEAQLQKELESLRKQASTPPPPRAGDRGAAELSRRLDEKSKAADELEASLAQCRAAARDAADATRAKEEGERTRLAAQMTQLTERAAALETKGAACEARNARMYKVGKDIIDWLSNVGVGAALAAREPFLGLKRVELENTAQDYQDKLLEQKVKP